MVALLRKPIVKALLVVLAAGLAVALYLFQPWLIFIDETVDESAPEVGSTQQGQPLPAQGGPATPAPRTPAKTALLSSGSFISHEHKTSGTVKLIRLPDGRHILRLENLDTSNGPDLRVWMSDQPVKKGTAGWFAFDDGAYAELGKLKGNKGNQNYTVPEGADLVQLTSVSIWCKRFNVSFGAAALQRVQHQGTT